MKVRFSENEITNKNNMRVEDYYKYEIPRRYPSFLGLGYNLSIVFSKTQENN